MSGLKEKLKQKQPAPVITILKRLRQPFTWHTMQVGGMWDGVCNLQFAFLVAQGLESYHHFLDVSCGCACWSLRSSNAGVQ